MAHAALVGLDPEKMLRTRSDFELKIRSRIIERVRELREEERAQQALMIRNHIARMLSGDNSA